MSKETVTLEVRLSHMRYLIKGSRDTRTYSPLMNEFLSSVSSPILIKLDAIDLYTVIEDTYKFTDIELNLWSKLVRHFSTNNTIEFMTEFFIPSLLADLREVGLIGFDKLLLTAVRRNDKTIEPVEFLKYRKMFDEQVEKIDLEKLTIEGFLVVKAFEQVMENSLFRVTSTDSISKEKKVLSTTPVKNTVMDKNIIANTTHSIDSEIEEFQYRQRFL